MIQKKIRERLHKFITQSFVFDLLPISSELLAVENILSVQDLVDIISENLIYYSLILDSNEQLVSDIFLSVDLNNFLISFTEENKQYLTNKEERQKFLKQMTIKELLTKYKYMKKPKFNEIISINVIQKDEIKSSKSNRSFQAKKNWAFSCKKSKAS